MKTGDFKKASQTQKRLAVEYKPQVEALGYYMASGISWVGTMNPRAPVADHNKLCIVVKLIPMGGSPDPITDETFAKIRAIVPEKFEDVPVFVEYVGVVRAL